MNATSDCLLGPSRLSKIRQVSRIAWIVCLILMTVRLGNTLRDILAHDWSSPWWYPSTSVPAEMQANVGRFERLSYFLDLAKMLITYGLFAALFHGFEKGQIFSSGTVRIIRYLGCWYVAYYVLRVLTPSLCGLPSPLEHPIGLLVQIESLLIGAGIVLASWVIDEGRQVQEEQSLTI